MWRIYYIFHNPSSKKKVLLWKFIANWIRFFWMFMVKKQQKQTYECISYNYAAEHHRLASWNICCSGCSHCPGSACDWIFYSSHQTKTIHKPRWRKLWQTKCKLGDNCIILCCENAHPCTPSIQEQGILQTFTIVNCFPLISFIWALLLYLYLGVLQVHTHTTVTILMLTCMYAL